MNALNKGGAMIALVIVAILNITSPGLAQTATVYVDIANGSLNPPNLGQDGWGTDSYRFLQDALDAADALFGAPHFASDVEIWVAAGTYRPDQYSVVDSSCFDQFNDPCTRCCTFRLRNNVTIRGGYDGTEGPTDSPDPVVNVTILSGDLNGDDNFSYSVGPLSLTFGQYGDNSRHVVRATNVNDTAVLDGFTIRGGAAPSSGSENRGAGLRIEDAGPRIRNCVIRENSAGYGGGVFVGSSSAQTRFTNCTIELNESSGVVVDAADVLFIRSSLMSNLGGLGGGMYAYNGSLSTRTIEMVNCIVTGNRGTSADGGGGIASEKLDQLVLHNCLIADNEAAGGPVPQSSRRDALASHAKATRLRG